MADDLLRRTVLQRGGCRLCLAPDTECVPIFATAAADKEPLSTKILSCVSIKILQTDRISLRVCHACISYLNSWQSFKNRCMAAQKKQRGLLEIWLNKERTRQKMLTTNLQQQQFERQRHLAQQRSQLAQQRILKQALSQPSNQLDFASVKQEPEEMTSDLENIDDEDKMVLDPTQFLARDDDDDADDRDEDGSVTDKSYSRQGGPPILTSLGLTHINHVNPFNYLSTELGPNDSQTDENDSVHPSNRPLPSCTICNMTFSNRANARRHERNIHGKKNIQISTSPNHSITLSTVAPAPVSISLLNRSLLLPRRKLIIPPSSEQAILFNYDKPEQYRSLLTDAKLHWIRRHIEFLEQYQNMRCKCCNKDFPTYKFFMAHMRKKYDTLSRNLCFKCLRQFQSKAQFIAHLKKKNCLNLFKVFMADDTISKEPIPPPPPRGGAKEVLSNKMYGCKLCTKTFRLKMDVRGHVYEAHPDKQKREGPPNTCGFCEAKFEDSGFRKRHISNMECLVFLICGTCNERFDTNPAFVDHVYSTHLQVPEEEPNGLEEESNMDVTADSINLSNELDSTGVNQNDSLTAGLSQPNRVQSKGRTPQNCTECGKQYNNWYNVLRHMESKHPDKVPAIYRCETCNIGFPRQSELRDHMQYVHGETLPKLKRELFQCRMCPIMVDSRELWIEHMSRTHSKFFCNLCEFESEDKVGFQIHLTNHGRQHKCTICKHSFNSERGLETHLAVMHGLKKDQMPPEKDDDDEESAAGRPIKIEATIDIPMNGENDEDEDLEGMDDEDIDDEAYDELLEDGNVADNDETLDLENPLKKIKLEPGLIRVKQDLTSRGVTLTSTSPNIRFGPSKTHSRLRCRICQKRIHTKIGYKRHMLTVHQVQDCVFMKCTLCTAEFSNEKGLKVHMFRTHQITVQQLQENDLLMPEPKQETTSNIPSTSITVTSKPPVFECDICHTVYRGKEQLKAHKAVVHGDGVQIKQENAQPLETTVDDDEIVDPPLPVSEAWWQCRYCDETFNASKKLTIHMNAHEEHDATDNTCKDCGNAYRTRKSLWVHRHKKHPRHANPSPCELCNKVFFDKTELFHHLKTHSNADVIGHLQEMHQQLEEEQQQNAVAAAANKSTTGPPEVYNCRVCGQKFNDKRTMSKHIRMHEESGEGTAGNSSFTNSPLAKILTNTVTVTEENGSSTDPNDYLFPPYKMTMVNGEFACDMCSKRFSQITALRVHRGWHFRSSDGRQITESSTLWQSDGNPRAKRRSGKAPVCPYCGSTFASGNNLRRHIVEVHKRNEARQMRENGAIDDNIFIEKELECRQCQVSFATRLEWVDHKISDAKTMKPSTTFEWGCEICGRVFTRKERLLAHMVSHLSGREDENNSMHSLEQFESNSQSSLSSQSHSQGSEMVNPQHDDQSNGGRNRRQPEDDNVELEDDNAEPEDDVADREDDIADPDDDAAVVDDEEDEPDDIDDEEDDEDDEQSAENDDNSMSGEQESATTYSCDLCQVFFRTAKELRKHVTSHILNGPDVTNSSQESDDLAGDEHVTGSPTKGLTQKSLLLDGFKCRLCGSSSESHIGMIQCMESHKLPTSVRCGDCQLFFNNEQHVKQHQALCHPKDFLI